MSLLMTDINLDLNLKRAASLTPHSLNRYIAAERRNKVLERWHHYPAHLRIRAVVCHSNIDQSACSVGSVNIGFHVSCCGSRTQIMFIRRLTASRDIHVRCNLIIFSLRH